MAISVDTDVSYQWRGTRFRIQFHGNLEANQTSTSSCNFRLRGNWTLTIWNDYGDRVIYPASDYIAFVKGDQDFVATGAGSTSAAYKHGLPYGINAGTGNIICETRVDSYRYGDPNGGTIWSASSGGIGYTTQVGTHTCSIDESYTLPLNGSGDQIVLRYFSSGSDRNTIAWIADQSWVYVKVQQFIDEGSIMFDYRPGERKISGTWYSHNRGNGGWAERKNGSWYEMRTVDGGSGSGDPPERKISGSWKNQSKLGAT